MSGQSGSRHSSTRHALRARCLAAWEAGHGVSAALEALRVEGTSVARDESGAALEIRPLLARYGAAASELRRVQGHLEGLYDALCELSVVVREDPDVGGR